MQTILVATTNPGKVRELRALLGGGVEWKTLTDFPQVAEVKEDGTTFAENACKKATGYAHATGLWTLADDSGLVVDALGGAPGVNSARFSGERPRGADRKIIDRRNMGKVLSLLKGVPADKRTARFVCCLCLASPERILIETQGTVEGVIKTEPAGTGGFGYDPIFFVPSLGRTVAQLEDDQKNAVSHRGNAIRKLKPLLDNLLSTQGHPRR
ncbi:MAG: non-canonical purine NTP pyrophosphatase, RdgB/HAM1 family [Planctomycetes bacterium RBG_13_60_9]|nr:MAG: non-canonical purine NTP pyrophosphatase, RdgB/HAM1 family [Planctomycetes bacterium RBG_13_60_9]